MTFKLGKTAARAGAVQFQLTNYIDKTVLPTPPRSFGHQNLLPGNDWGILANDRVGCCVLSGAAHETILWNEEAGNYVRFDDHSVLSDYSAITGYNPADPSTDQGTDMQVAASYQRKTGVLDENGKRHKVAAYLAIKPRNKAELQLAIYLFSAVGIGIKFPSSAMAQFEGGLPWSVVKDSRTEGGHYVPAVGYDGTYVYVVTWGKLQKVTWAFFSKYCDEAVTYLSSEMLTNGKSPEGFNVAQLQADLAALPK